MFERNYVTFNSTGNSVLFQQQIHHVFLRLSNIVYTDKVKSRESTFRFNDNYNYSVKTIKQHATIAIICLYVFVKVLCTKVLHIAIFLF